MTAISGREGEGGHHQEFQPLQAPPGDDELFQIPGTGDFGVRKQLAGGDK